MRFFGWIIICVIFFSVSISYGQTDSTQWPDRISISMALGASKPLNAFDRKYSGTPWSVSVQMGIKPNQDRFQFIEFDFNYQRLTEYQNIFPIQSPQGGLIDINHSTRSNLLFLGAGYRYEFDQFWYIIPKVSLSFGGCNAYVFTSLRDNFTDEVIENYRQASDWSYYSSLQMGCSIPVYPGVQISFCMNYLNSGSLNIFLPRQDVLNPPPVDPFNNFELRRSVINLLAIEIGVTLYLRNFN